MKVQVKYYEMDIHIESIEKADIFDFQSLSLLSLSCDKHILLVLFNYNPTCNTIQDTMQILFLQIKPVT